jgi:hypothetical protein
MKKIFTTKIILTVFAILSNFIVWSCKCSDDDLTNRKPKPWDKILLSVDDIEEQKAGKIGVKTRITYSKFYNNFGKLDTATYLAEKLFFNRNGRIEQRIQYLSTGRVFSDWRYEYTHGIISRRVSKNSYDEKMAEEIISFDDNMDETEFKEYNYKSQNYNKTIVKYDKNKFVAETITLDPKGNQISKTVYEYKLKNLYRKKEFDRLGTLAAETIYEYDNQNRLIKETKTITGVSTKLVLEIKYDKDKISEIIDRDYVIKYDYANGKIVKEHHSIIGIGPQRRFDYFYNSKGLIKTKVHVSGMGKPELHVFYRYEYY